jgi:hypothetical protein
MTWKWCHITNCWKPSVIRISTKSGKTEVASYCKEHSAFGLHDIAMPGHIIELKNIDDSILKFRKLLDSPLDIYTYRWTNDVPWSLTLEED